VTVSLDLKAEASLDKERFATPPLSCTQSFTGLPGGGNRVIDTSAYGNRGYFFGTVEWVRLPSGVWAWYFGLNYQFISAGYPLPSDFKDLSFSWWAYDCQGKAVRMWGQANVLACQQYNTTTAKLRTNLLFSDGSSDYGTTVCYYTAKKWHHWVWNFAVEPTGLNFTCYRDGLLKRTLFFSGKTLKHQFNHGFSWGMHYGYGADTFNGYQALMKIYIQIMPPFEVQRLYERERELVSF